MPLSAAKRTLPRDDGGSRARRPTCSRRTNGAASIERWSGALLWLASQQDADGSFPTIPNGQPGVTSLCMMAFMAHGHVPGDGRYGERLERATDYVLTCQKENGLVDACRSGRAEAHADRGGPRDRHLRGVQSRDLVALAERDVRHEPNRAGAADRGGGRAGFGGVAGDAALAEGSRRRSRRLAVHRRQRRGRFRSVDHRLGADVSAIGAERRLRRAEAADRRGGGVRAAVLRARVWRIRVHRRAAATTAAAAWRGREFSRWRTPGFINSPEAQQSGEWLLEHDFREYNVSLPFTQQLAHDRYHYGLFNCCQGMYQLGGEYWEAVLSADGADAAWTISSRTAPGRSTATGTTANSATPTRRRWW